MIRMPKVRRIKVAAFKKALRTPKARALRAAYKAPRKFKTPKLKLKPLKKINPFRLGRKRNVAGIKLRKAIRRPARARLTPKPRYY